jgi:hypothetical protein
MSDGEHAGEGETRVYERDDPDDGGLLPDLGLGVDLPVGKLVAYVAGGLLIYTGATSVGSNAVGGALTVFLGVIALPVVRAQMGTGTRVWLSRWTKLLAVILVALASDQLLGVDLVPEAVTAPLERLLT